MDRHIYIQNKNYKHLFMEDLQQNVISCQSPLKNCKFWKLVIKKTPFFLGKSLEAVF
jgi:hypothetical protein